MPGKVLQGAHLGPYHEGLTDCAKGFHLEPPCVVLRCSCREDVQPFLGKSGGSSIWQRGKGRILKGKQRKTETDPN